MNFCQANHPDHATKVVPVKFHSGLGGRMAVFDADLYSNTNGYCTGDDVVSRTLSTEGQWERWNTEALVDRGVFCGNLVYDCGAHIGWFSILAALSGCDVVAYEGDYENADLLKWNAALNRVSDLIVVREEWIDDDWVPESEYRQVDLIKSDLEGNDQYVVNAFWDLIEAELVHHLLIEVSPVFKPGYPDMVERLLRLGYKAEVSGPEFFELPSVEWIESCHQADILFTLESR